MKPFHDEDAISLLEGVHEHRRIHACLLCKGLGVEGCGMFVVEERRAKQRASRLGLPGRRLSATFAHVRCWMKVNGRNSIFRLKPTQADCITLDDVRRFGNAFVQQWMDMPRRCISHKAPRSGQVIGGLCCMKAQPKSDWCARHGRGRM